MANDDAEVLNYDNLEAVAHLQATSRYKTIMEAGSTLFHIRRPFL